MQELVAWFPPCLPPPCALPTWYSVTCDPTFGTAKDFFSTVLAWHSMMMCPSESAWVAWPDCKVERERGGEGEEEEKVSRGI